MISSLRKYDLSEVAKKRMEILNFYDKYGEAATKEAFGADRKVISRWRKRLVSSSGKLQSLSPLSTRPRRTRTAIYSSLVVDEIARQRQTHPRLGKAKLKPLLDTWCQENRIASVSQSTIGNIIKRNKLFYQKDTGRIYHNPARVHPVRAKRTRVRHSPKHLEPGHIISDTITIFVDGVKEYFYCAIDTQMKFALTLPYPRLNSRHNADFFNRFRSVYPGQIIDWQTDNGGENLGEFDTTLQQNNIPHLFSYPRCPKINSYIERYNRTFQEEFLYPHIHLIHEPEEFSHQLAEYLVWYNTIRPHQTLGQISPLNYFLQKGGMSQMSLTYTPN